jgi:iron complex outermembrane receptor protein
LQRTIKALLGLTTALALVQAAPAFAQAAPDGNAGDIIVTARRVEERLQDVPISITVFNQQELSTRNIVAASDLATYTPSLTTNSFFGSDNTTFSIRGFNQQFGTLPTVGVYFADVISPRGASNNIPVGDGAGPGSFFDLQNVQVLKGPQGTLFGLNTTGGAVLLVPQKPTDKFEGYVEGSYGNVDMKRIQAVVNVPISDNVRFRIGVDHQTRDGYLKNVVPVGPRDFDDVNYTAVRASLDINVTPNIENYTIASYAHSRTNGDLARLYIADPTTFLGSAAAAEMARYGSGFYDTGNSIANPSTTLRTWQIINTTTWLASDTLTIKNVVSYAQLREDIISSLFGSYLDLYDASVNVPGLGAYFPYRSIYTAPGQGIVGLADVFPIPGGHTADQSTFSEEFQVQGHAFGEKLQYQGGIYYESSNPVGTQGSLGEVTVFCTSLASTTCANPLGAGTVSPSYGRTSFRDVGLYTQETYSFTDKFKMTAGLRYTWDRQSLNGVQYDYLYGTTFTPTPPITSPTAPDGYFCTSPEVSLPACAYSFREKSHAPTWLIDFDYLPTRDVLAYVKYSRGYRGGGISGGAPTQYATYKPEKLDAYEVGLKTSFRGQMRATLDIAAFYNDFHDEQALVNFYPIITGALPQETAIVNANKSRSYGVEVAGNVMPFQGFTLDASYAYTNARITDIPAVTLPASSPFFAVSAARNGDREQFVPKNKYTITASYVLPLAASIGKLSFGATFSHSDSQVAQYAARNAAGGLEIYSILNPRNLLDLNLSWSRIAGSPFDLQLFATNVTNEQYYTDKSGLYTAAGYDTASVGPPRMYGARLRFNFGR